MRSNGLATILLMIPVLSVPALAIFGIPQFSPVQDSNLNDFRETTRESRIGHSTKQSQDDLFGDIESFGSETEDPLPKRQETAPVDSNDRNSGSRRKNETATSTWEDDSDSDADMPIIPQRRQSSIPPDDQVVQDLPLGTKSPKKPAIIDKSTRRSKFQQQGVTGDDPNRSAIGAESDQRVIQAGFEDENEPEKPKLSAKGKRSQLNESRPPKSSDSAGGPLTWKVANERLNNLDIHNFRLERGHEADQFIFICSYSPPDTPRVSYRFEAEADEPLKAVEKVLDQIVVWQQQRK